MTNRRSKLPGVTLIELLIVMAIFPIILIALSWVLATITEGQLRAIAQSSLDQEQQFLLSRIGADVARASLLLLPATPGASASALQLQLPEGQVQYSLSNGRLFRQDSSSSAMVHSSRVQVTAFSAARLGSPSGFPSVRMSIDLTSTASAQSNQLRREVDTTFGLRMKP